MNQQIIENASSPKSQLEWLRVLMLPALLTSLVILPGLLLAAFMASDSGTPEAIRGSYIAILLVLAYTGSVFISMLVWEKAALLSGILLSLFTIGNVATAIYLQTTSLLIAFIPWYGSGFRAIALPEPSYRQWRVPCSELLCQPSPPGDSSVTRSNWMSLITRSRSNYGT